MSRYVLQVSDELRPDEDVWIRAGAKLRMCIDEFDDPKDAVKQMRIQTDRVPAILLGVVRLRVWDKRERKAVKIADPLREMLDKARADLEKAREEIARLRGVVSRKDAELLGLKKTLEGSLEETSKKVGALADMVPCPHCDKRFKKRGLHMHIRRAHGAEKITANS